jgi:hypothetical protein
MIPPFAGAAAKDLYSLAGAAISKERHRPDLLDPDAMLEWIVRGGMDVNIEDDGVIIAPSQYGIVDLDRVHDVSDVLFRGYKGTDVVTVSPNKRDNARRIEKVTTDQ